MRAFELFDQVASRALSDPRYEFQLKLIPPFFPLGLVKGLNEVCKALDRKQALLCVLAKDCDDTKYKKLIEALAKSNGIPLINVEHKMDLGEWLGHCKYDKEHNPRKVKATSSVAVVEYGEESEALSFVINY